MVITYINTGAGDTEWDPCLKALVKRQLEMDDDEDDDIVNNKKAKRAHIADDDDADDDPIKPETPKIEDVLVNADGEEEENQQNDEHSVHDLSQPSELSQEELSQEQKDGNNEDAIN